MRFFRQSPEGTHVAKQQALIDTAPPPDLYVAGADTPGTVQLSILWSAREPARVGETASFVPGRVQILGRAPQLEAGEEPLRFLAGRKGRPGQAPAAGSAASVQSGDLQGEALSRRQLEFSWQGSMLMVRNIGRCPLWINGALHGRARVRHGDTLHLQNQLVLLVLWREPQPGVPAVGGGTCGIDSDTSFGVADADGLVGESAAMWRLRQQIAQHGPSEDHVLVIGPSGAGKELVANALHRRSPRAERPLVSENVATLPSSLATTLLFGNRRNFPNPGMEERPGLVGMAESGTLFLDEIGDMGSDVQPLLLRVMERSGEYVRMGDETKPRRANVRFVAATNHPERLRPELRRRFQREIHIPGLQARPEDIPLLARHLLLRQLATRGELARFFDAGQLRTDPRLIEQLVWHRYTTHVAELSFLLEQAIGSSCDDLLVPLSKEALLLRASHPPPDDTYPPPDATAAAAIPSEQEQPADTDRVVAPAKPGPLPAASEAQQALDATAGSIVAAAKQLGINRHQLNRLIRRHGLVVPRGGKKEPTTEF
jgi:two-component system nitrogen regulation response regulator GlnG/two-component system response regulator HydG